MYAVFDENKNFISYSDTVFQTQGSLSFKEISLDKSDLLKWRWEGDCDTGQMVLISENAYPETYNQNTFESKFPFSVFLSIILKQLFLISEKLDSTDIVFKQMIKEYLHSFENESSYIDLLQEANKIKRENKNRPNS
jgi:hypothetical protein